MRYSETGYYRKMTASEQQPQINRQQKILAAKASFQQTPSGGRRYNREMSGYMADLEEVHEDAAPVFHFGLFRFMTSIMLVLVLIGAFASNFEYRGFNKRYVQECMSDESLWNRVEQKVQKIYYMIQKESIDNSSDMKKSISGK